MKKYLIFFSLSLFVFLIWYFIPKNHSIIAEGISYQLGNEKEEKIVVVTVDLKTQNTFTGKKIVKANVTIAGEKMPTPVGDSNTFFTDKNRGYITYGYLGENAYTSIYSYGTIYLNDDYTELTINKYTKENDNDNGGTWLSDNGFMISAPAKNRNEALAISNKLMKNTLEKGTVLK